MESTQSAFVNGIESVTACLFKTFLSIALTLVIVLIFSGAAQGQRLAIGDRFSPAPEGYEVTPFGYFHSSCVKHLLKGDAVREDLGIVQHADGSAGALASCSYPNYAANGKSVTPEGAKLQPTIAHSYIEYESVTTSTSYSKISAQWIVPPTPTSSDGQTLFFFPGFEDTANTNTKTILQPVLGWNEDYQNAWSIASWNCCVAGFVYEAPPEKAIAGDTIVGTIQSTCGAGVLSCASWNVTTSDATSGLGSTLSQTSSFGQTFNWAFAGALEVYNVISCADYPPDGSILFSYLELYDYNDNPVYSPNWSIAIPASGQTPQCNYGGKATPQQVELTYGVPSPPNLNQGRSCEFQGGKENCFDYVQMSDSESSAAIYYTTNGTTPTTSSSVYNGIVGYTPTVTFKAIAVIGSDQSAVVTLVANGGGNQ